MGRGGNGGQLVSVYPEELTFGFELGKSCYCNIKVVNNTEHHVAFKVKTTSPKKYFVRPNTRVVQPWDSQIITVTLQAQGEYPADMQCKDKFLIQSTIVPPRTDIDEVPPNTFDKDADQAIEEHKLRVVYVAPGQSNQGDDSGVESPMSRGSRRIFDHLPKLNNSSSEQVQAVQRLKEERDAALQQNQLLQRELEMIKRRRSRKNDAGFSLAFAAFVGAIGLMLGFILNLLSASPPAA
uniref:Vesicle-associated protein 2-1 n=1 Tax=Anthurium amnicola TaxID=1678845 RepID=A0A1D1YRL1_9ARAE